MRDIHCHILPGVDDGARDLDESLRMLDAARAAGVTSITCTPHCRDPYFDYDKMWAAFDELKAHAGDMELRMGFEVNHTKLSGLGMEWARYLGVDGTGEFLLELSTRADKRDFVNYDRTIYDLQSLGYTVIIAHPERYRAIQRDVALAERLVEQGCLLQASADFMRGGRLGGAGRQAKSMLKEGLYTYIASDAHEPSHYDLLARAWQRYGGMLRDA